MFGLLKRQKPKVCLVNVEPVEFDDRGIVIPESVVFTQKVVGLEELDPKVRASVERALQTR